MRIIALLFVFVLAGCTGNRLNAETNPIAVALCAPPMATAFGATAPASPMSLIVVATNTGHW
jgi:hypothetical protein